MVLCACNLSDTHPDITATPTPIVSIATTPFPTPSSGQLLMSAEQIASPAMAWSDEALLVTWIGTDDQDIRHFAQWHYNATWQPIQTLSLLTNNPHHQQLVTIPSGVVYLLWLDALPTYPEPQRIWYAPIAMDYSITPGALPLSNIEARDYTALAHPNGGLWVVWVGGLLSEPTLYGQYIESGGRPRLSERILDNASHPSLVADSIGRQWLFWLSENRLWRAEWHNGVLIRPRAIAESVRLGRGELLEGFSVGIGGEQAVAIWHIIQRDGTPRTFWTVGDLDTDRWTAPQPHSTLWLTPNQITDTTLYVAGITASEPYHLRIYQWTGDSWWSKHEGVTLGLRLLNPPALMRRPDGQTVLGWSQPNWAFANIWLWQSD